jgi:hypothetical protein
MHVLPSGRTSNFQRTLGHVEGAHTGNKWAKMIEFWNNFTNYFIAALIGYYFVVTLWPDLAKGQNINFSGVDFVLFIVFLLGLFGHLCVMSHNITEGINAIIERVFRRG